MLQNWSYSSLHLLVDFSCFNQFSNRLFCVVSNRVFLNTFSKIIFFTKTKLLFHFSVNTILDVDIWSGWIFKFCRSNIFHRQNLCQQGNATKYSENSPPIHHTLHYQIGVPIRLFILHKNSHLYFLIQYCIFIKIWKNFKNL